MRIEGVPIETAPAKVGRIHSKASSGSRPPRNRTSNRMVGWQFAESVAFGQ